MEMKTDALPDELEALIKRLKANPNDAEAMGELYDRANEYDRDTVGNLLALNKENKFESPEYLEALTKNAAAIEFARIPKAEVYLREPTLATKLMYLEAASRVDDSDVKMFTKNTNKFCKKLQAPDAKTHYQVTDAQLGYYTPVYEGMNNSTAYVTDATSSKREKIGTNLAYNLVLLPIITKLNLEKKLNPDNKADDLLAAIRMQKALLKLSRETRKEFKQYPLLLLNLEQRLKDQAQPVQAVSETNASASSPEATSTAKTIFGRFFPGASRDNKPQEAVSVANTNNASSDSFMDMLHQEQAPQKPSMSNDETKPGASKADTTSDIDSVVKYVDNVADMVENLNTASCEKAINTLCTRIEKTVDFDQIEQYKAGELLDSLRVLASNAGNKIPADVSQRITGLLERLEVRAAQTPGQNL